MPQFLQYSLDSAICLAVLLLPYLIWFRKTTFHQWNRFYLLGAVLFSLSAPLVNIQIATETVVMPNLEKKLSFFEEMPQMKEQIPMGEPLPSDEITAYKQPEQSETSSLEQVTPHWDWAVVSLFVYVAGLLVFGSMFLFRLAKLSRLIRKAEKHREDGFVLVHLSGKQVFSFFSFVFLDKHRYKEKERATLLHHEQVHIQQKHSLDVLVLEILQVVFWFNPLYRIYRKFLQQEHEYFVDATTSKEIGQPQYAQLLLTLATTKQPVLGHAFAYIPIKHRIFKLFQKPSTTMERSRFFIALPIALSLFLVFSCSFDELEGIKDDSSSIGTQVKSVQAYFTDEQSALKQEVNVGSMELNEDGSIADLEMKAHPVFGNNVPSNIRNDNSWYFRTDFFKTIRKRSNLPVDFFAKNSQWLFAGDIDIREPYIETLLYAPYGRELIMLKRQLLSEEAGFDVTDISSKDANGYYFSGNRFRDTKPFTTEQSIVRELEVNGKGQLLLWKETDELDYVWGKQKAKDELLDSILRKEIVRFHKVVKSIELRYSPEDLVKELVSSLSMDAEFNGEKSGPHLLVTGILKFIHGEQDKIKEVLIFKGDNTIRRKYRFHYNEAGYCIKKECINRGGSVEFSVRFEYDFFD